MKKIIFLIVISVIALFYNVHTANAEALWNCTRFELTTHLTGQWPGGTVSGSCHGDTGTSGCSGITNKPITIADGAITTFDRCSCFNQPNNQACLNIPSNFPAGCTGQVTGPYCGTNGDYLYPQLNITCQPAATSTPVPTATIGPTATPVPTTTIIPTATPTPTPALCGVGCTDNPSKCGDIPNCNYCNPATHTCTAPLPVTTPTATPTPNPFNTAMCKCDNITLEPASFVAGQKVNVVAYSKVEGGDLSYATIPTMIFNSERYTDPQHGIRDMPLDVSIGTTIVEQSATKIRYKATWSYTIPANPDPKVVYKVRSVPQCVQKTAGIQSSSRVADTTAPVTVSANKNIFSQIIDFILNIFGKKSTSKIQSSDTIQLDVLKMGEISGTDHCTYIEFQVK